MIFSSLEIFSSNRLLFSLRGNVPVFCANSGLVVRLQASRITGVEIAFVQKEMLKGRIATGTRRQI